MSHDLKMLIYLKKMTELKTGRRRCDNKFPSLEVNCHKNTF
jgi:hypothetical protein